MKKVVAMICALLVVGPAAIASAAVPGAHVSSKDGLESGCADPVEPTRTFAVKLRVLDDEYRIGEKARFRVLVHRILGGQDVGPVEGAQIAVAVSLDDVTLWDGGVTDSYGRTLVKVALKRYAPAGRADVSASASKLIAINIPCHSQLEYEYGSVRKREFFRVVR